MDLDFRLTKQDDYFWVVLITFEASVVFWGSLGSSKNRVMPETLPQLQILTKLSLSKSLIRTVGSNAVVTKPVLFRYISRHGLKSQNSNLSGRRWSLCASFKCSTSYHFDTKIKIFFSSFFLFFARTFSQWFLAFATAWHLMLCKIALRGFFYNWI